MNRMRRTKTNRPMKLSIRYGMLPLSFPDNHVEWCSQIRTSFVLLLRQTDHLAVKGDLLVLRFGRADGSAWRTIRGSLPSHLSLGRNLPGQENENPEERCIERE